MNENTPGFLETDSDFGFAISNTLDSIKVSGKRSKIDVIVTSMRYVKLKDCKNGPVTIDRKTVDYGIILSSKGKSIDTVFNSVHGGDYLQEIDEYFELEK